MLAYEAKISNATRKDVWELLLNLERNVRYHTLIGDDTISITAYSGLPSGQVSFSKEWCFISRRVATLRGGGLAEL
jgi:hypothetical protein